MKRFASHYLYKPEEGYLKRHIVEIGEDGYFIRSFPFMEEIESVSWVSGVIVLEENIPGKFKAFHLYPFDFEKMQPVDETQRIPLQ
ncbi:MAG: hypothetical protein LUH22_04750 [Bacteroides sp.]|nr:hypothetical protein [Bacteroides sp.]